MSQKVIELKGVSIYQPQGVVTVLNEGNFRRRGELVLSDVNLSVSKGEMVYFIGRVGSGKSSLLSLMVISQSWR